MNKHDKSGKRTKAYTAWRNMMQRCYRVGFLKTRPSYIGCTVCDEWQDFSVFASWFSDNYIEGCHLDKDIKITGNKIYSPETCLFVSKAENTLKAMCKSYSFIDPLGVAVNIYNMSKFCKDKVLDNSAMCRVYRGEASHHKGWVKA